MSKNNLNQVECKTCSGNGTVLTVCSKCDGSGFIEIIDGDDNIDYGDNKYPSECKDCYGSGEIEKICPTCAGMRYEQ